MEYFNKVFFNPPYRITATLIKKIQETGLFENLPEQSNLCSNLGCDCTSITEYIHGTRDGKKGMFLSDLVLAVDEYCTRMNILLTDKDGKHEISIHNYHPEFESNYTYIRPYVFEPNFGHGVKWIELAPNKCTKLFKRWENMI